MRALWILSIAANLAAALQLYRLALYRWFPSFFAFLIFTVARSVFSYSLDIRSSTDEMGYLLTVPVMWILSVAVVLEIYRNAISVFPGIYALRRIVLGVAMVLSTLVSVIVFPRDSETSDLLFWITTLDHSVRWSLLTLVLLLVIFCSRYPIRLRRNLVVHGIIYSIYFLTDTFSSAAGQVNQAAVIVSTACYVAWAVALTRADEERRVDLNIDRHTTR